WTRSGRAVASWSPTPGRGSPPTCSKGSSRRSSRRRLAVPALDSRRQSGSSKRTTDGSRSPVRQAAAQPSPWSCRPRQRSSESARTARRRTTRLARHSPCDHGRQRTACDGSPATGSTWRSAMTVDALMTPQQVIEHALEGHFPKPALAGLLSARARRPFYDACGVIEMKYTEACRANGTPCRAAGNPCLASGCSAEGERCLQPILAAGRDYDKACAAVWAPLFADGANRDLGWRVTVSEYDVD